METQDCLTERRKAFADHITACCDTVSIMRVEEVEYIRQRALAGEFDADLDWRSPHLGQPVSRGEFPCAGGPE